MTKELPDVTRRLTNWFNTCWLQAGVKELEFAHFKATGEGKALSAEHMMLAALEDRYLKMINGAAVMTSDLESGGELNEVRQLALKYGIVPESTWSQAIRRDWSTISKDAKQLATLHRSRLRRDSTNRQQILQKAQEDFQQLLEGYGLRKPSWFLLNGERITPRDFAKQLIQPSPPDNHVLFIATPVHGEGVRKQDLPTVQDGFVTSWKNIQAAILHEISQERSVLLSLFWSESAIKITNGIMRVIVKPLPEDKLVGHVVNIVGYRTDAQGRIEQLKLENSWGRYEGASGYYSVSWDDLKEMYQAINVPDGFNFATQRGMQGTKMLD
jgi:hypothetical protein